MSPRRSLDAPISRSLCRLVSIMGVLALVTLGCRSQNSNDTPDGLGVPSASFSQSATSGAPGLVVQFSDTSTGAVTGYAWDFGNGARSSDPNPQVSYADAGVYTVALTVTGSRGTSTRVMSDLIQVASPPTAGFTCTPEVGFVPLTIACVSQGIGTATVSWSFGDGSFSGDVNPTHRFDVPGTYSVTQTVETAGGRDTATTSVQVLPLSITSNPPSGSAPGDVMFTADLGGLGAGLETWFLDGTQVIGSGRSAIATLRTPGTYTIEYFYASTGLGLVGQASVDFVVSYGPIVADFEPSETEAAGPLTVVMNDQSLGEIVQWEWDFGDGSACIYPEPPGGVTPPLTVCNASSPTHTYENVDRYDVRLVVTGRDQVGGNADVTAGVVRPDAVTVTIVDPSFENQTIDAEIGAGWSVLRPPAATATAQHIALSDAGARQPDAGMPTDGSGWAALDGLGTDGSTPVDLIENGIQQSFLLPANESVIEFDFALLYSEPPASSVLDAITATVTDGTTTVEIPSARADVSSAYAGPSLRYPTLDGGVTRVTPVHSASLDLATAFPGAPADTRYTLTIRLANDLNGFRSPRAYVDNIRFSAPETQPVASFSVSELPVVTGRPVEFLSGSCPADWDRNEALPRSYRWDFDTGTSTIPPASSGSNEQCPTYTFEEAGLFDVSLTERNGDKESSASLLLTVLEAPLADFGVTFAGDDPSAPATVTFDDLSTSDPADPIVAWSWDFAGWGTSTLPNPPAVLIPQVGDWSIRLTITTAAGLSDTLTSVITVD